MFFFPRVVEGAFAILFTFLVISGQSADAQSFLYNSSAIAAGSGPIQAIVRDFNGDGRADLASVNYNNTVSIMLGQANATFAAPVSYAIGNSPYTFTTASLRKNNKFDVITVNMPNGIDSPGTVSILLGNGDGTFAAHVDYQVGNYPTGVIAGDFNDDGKIDLAISNNFDNTVSILYGNGDGTFLSQFLVDVGNGPMSIGTGDLNGDGKADIITSSVGSSVVSVLLNGGKGKFTRVDSASNLINPDSSLVITGDFNGDGYIDAIISSQINQNIYFLAGKGNGGFGASVSLSKTGLGRIYSLVAADVNKDGKVDLVFGAVGPTGVFVLLGQGNGKFGAPIISTVAGVNSVALADVNGDGQLDLAVPSEALNLVEIALGNGKGEFGAPKITSTTSTAYGPNSSAAADFNGDGKPDLAIAETNFPTGQIAFLPGNGKGGFGTPIISPLLSEAINNADLMLSGDFNGDGKLDLILMDDYSQGFQVLMGNGDGSFQMPVDTKLNTQLNFAIGDFNSDGKTDVVVTTIVNAQVVLSIYLSKGDGTFALGAQYTNQTGGPVVADVNGDGKLDLVVASNPLFVMLGNGDGTFQKAVYGPLLTTATTPTIKDFDGDGRLDIVSGTYLGLAFLKGNGDGTFQKPVYSNTTLLICCELAVGDVNGDGKLDLINNDGAGVLIMLGKGDGSFELPGAYGADGQVFSGNFVVADFNGDSLSDIGLVYEDLSVGTSDAALYLSAPAVAVFPTAVNFGSVKVGQTSRAVPIEVANIGNGTLSSPSVAVSGDFVEQTTCTKKLAIGGSCAISAEFKPHAQGSQSGAVTIKDNALVSTQQVVLTGTGK